MIERFKKERFDLCDLLELVALLRSPEGCPWDREQTHRSVRREFLEEAYEAVDTIDLGDCVGLKEELGDVLLQVVFHAQMESEAGSFDFNDVADGICKKLISRHPHVFGGVSVSGSSEVLKNWDEIKKTEKSQNTALDSILSVPKALPALYRAQKVQKRARDAGFDWPDISGAADKLCEEAAEFAGALRENNSANAAEELGDLLFSAVNVARFLKLDPEQTLNTATQKFISRFAVVERLAQERGIEMKTAGIKELDKLWDEAKATPGGFTATPLFKGAIEGV